MRYGIEYLIPKRKKDLVDTMRMINENTYLIYENDNTNLANPDAYTIAKGSYKSGVEKYEYFTFEMGSVIGQYEIGDDLIIFEIEVVADELKREKAVYYAYYSITEDKFLKFPAKISRMQKSLVNFVNLKKPEDEKDIFAMHISCVGYNNDFLIHNTVDFFVSLPKFNLVPGLGIYSSYQDEVFMTRKFDDIKKILKHDSEEEAKLYAYYSEKNIDPRGQRAEVAILNKIR